MRLRSASLLLACLATAALPDAAASVDSAAAPVDTAAIEFAPIEALGVPSTPAAEPIYLGGRIVYTVRDSLAHSSAAARAAAIRSRLRAVARDRAWPLDDLRAIAAGAGAQIVTGRKLLLDVVPSDLEPNDHRDPLEVAQDLVPEIRRGIERERHQLTPGRLAVSVGLTLGLALAYWFVARFLVRRARSAGRGLGRRLGSLAGEVRLRGIIAFSPARAAAIGGRVLGALAGAANVLLAYACLSYVFSLFPWTQGWSSGLVAFAWSAVLGGASAVAAAAPDLVLAIAVLYAFHLLVRFMAGILDRVADGSLSVPGLHPELARPTKQLLRVFLWIAAIVIIYPLIPGSDSDAFRGVSILLGVVVSLGSTGLVENLLAGLVLTYARSFRVGERIASGELVGDVVTTGLLTTKLRTIKLEEVTIGNAQLLRGSVKNFSRQAAEGGGLILHTSVTIGYDAPWRTVHTLLIEAACATEGIEREPKPFVLQRALGDFYVEYEINAYTRRPTSFAEIYGALHANIQDAFNRAGVEIMSPHYRSIRDGNKSTIPAKE